MHSLRFFGSTLHFSQLHRLDVVVDTRFTQFFSIHPSLIFELPSNVRLAGDTELDEMYLARGFDPNGASLTWNDSLTFKYMLIGNSGSKFAIEALSNKSRKAPLITAGMSTREDGHLIRGLYHSLTNLRLSQRSSDFLDSHLDLEKASSSIGSHFRNTDRRSILKAHLDKLLCFVDPKVNQSVFWASDDPNSLATARSLLGGNANLWRNSFQDDYRLPDSHMCTDIELEQIGLTRELLILMALGDILTMARCKTIVFSNENSAWSEMCHGLSKPELFQKFTNFS